MSYSSKGRKVRRRRKSVNVRNLALLIGGAVVTVLLFILLISGAAHLVKKAHNALTKDKEEKVSSSVSESLPSVSSEPESEPEPALTYTTLQMTQVDEGQGDLILVNADHGYQSEVEDLLIFWGNKNKSYGIPYAEIYAKTAVVSAMNDMMADFSSNSSISNVLLYSAYRNAEDQQKMYQNELASTGESSSDLVAQAGHSEHQTGYAVDLSASTTSGYSYVDGTGSYAWLEENCYQYGFVIRYPEGKSSVTGFTYEPWHFRYVGKIHAEAMTKGDYCLEEYLEMLQLHDKDNPYSFVSESGANYLIYYVPSGGETTEVPIPQGKLYNLSGTNEGGFVVTVSLDSTGSTAASSATADSDASSEPAEDSASAAFN